MLNLLNKLFRNVVYMCTDKPKHYVHVDKAKTLQDCRQIQYNNWCKAKGVYNGSYLPRDFKKLTRKGWVDITSPRNNTGIKEYKRKSSGQQIRYDPENDDQFSHYHWYNPKPTRRKFLITKYLDRYGEPCTERDHSHHLAPLDAKYYKKKKKGRKNEKSNSKRKGEHTI